MWRVARQAAALAAAGVLAGVPATALGQEVHPGEQVGLGLRGPEVPALLKTVAADPYKAPLAPACETIPAEIMALDQILGPDAGEAQQGKSEVAAYATREAKGAVRGLIPYRSVIRFLTRADRKDRDLVAAAQAGWARRGFLRGLEANLRCSEPKLETAANATPPVRLAADVRRVETLYAAPELSEGASPDLATALRSEPPKERFDKPGR